MNSRKLFKKHFVLFIVMCLLLVFIISCQKKKYPYGGLEAPKDNPKYENTSQ